MIARRYLLAFLCLILLTLLTSPVQANPSTDLYELTWFTYDTGGGTVTSADGVYTLSSTAGQYDAGSRVGAGYSVDGGFWYSGIQGGSIYIPVVVR